LALGLSVVVDATNLRSIAADLFSWVNASGVTVVGAVQFVVGLAAGLVVSAGL
jgi:hypothetical protein